MKNHHPDFPSRTIYTLVLMVLLFVLRINAQSFQVKWTMDQTQAGVSSHANFTANNANLLGGPNTYALASIYSAGGAIGYGYIVRPWPTAFSTARCMEFTFSANQYEYHINSFSFRLRRSDTGPRQVVIRSSADNFSTNLYTLTLANGNVFYPATVPLSFNNLSNTNFSFRIYGYNPSNPTLGVLWFDELIVNGVVSNFILPVKLVDFSAIPNEHDVELVWETSWEKASDKFVIERSTDLVNFIPIGEMPAAGEADERLKYSFRDEKPLAGASYYRLKLVDTDKSFTYSGLKDVLRNLDPVVLTVSPNPASPDLIRLRRNNIDPGTLSLHNVSGQKIPFLVLNSEIDYIGLIPGFLLPTGLYVLSSTQNNTKVHAQVLVP